MDKILAKAFTLAEVLMVVGILGVVALFTIPNLKNDTVSETNVATLKATYNQLETALNLLLADYGSLQAVKDSCNSGTAVACLNSKIVEKLDLQLNCASSNLSRCYSSETLKNIDGGDVASGASNARCSYAFTLSNGASVCYVTAGDNYEIDINGSKKGPNVLGIDVFDTYFDANDDLSYDNPSTATAANTARAGGGAFTTGRDETAWAMTFGNIDYTKCKASLQWNRVTSCAN